MATCCAAWRPACSFQCITDDLQASCGKQSCRPSTHLKFTTLKEMEAACDRRVACRPASPESDGAQSMPCSGSNSCNSHHL